MIWRRKELGGCRWEQGDGKGQNGSSIIGKECADEAADTRSG
jgi:hypothetical protein